MRIARVTLATMATELLLLPSRAVLDKFVYSSVHQ